MSSNPDIPILRPADVTPDWMSHVLQQASFNAKVSGFEAKKVGTGQVGESVRFTLAYDGDPGGAPRTVVGKFPSPDETSRGAGIAFGNYVREVRFYNELAASALITAPRCLHADVDPDTGEFVLIMEDLAPATQGDQLRGVTVEQAALVLGEAAKLHASHWGEDKFDQCPWLFKVAAAPKLTSEDTMRTLWEGFCQRYGARATPAVRNIGEGIVAAYDRFENGYVGPRCLIHNDFRPDNMMFGTPEGGYPVAVVDWQSLGYGCCMADVSYFLGGAVSLDDRRTHEEALLRRYHQQLTDLGVTGYAFDQLWRDYGRYSFALFIMGFAASMVVERTARGDDMFFAMIETASAHIQDHNALALI